VAALEVQKLEGVRDEVKEKLFMASQWQLMRWRFARHKAAMVSLVVLVLLYLGVAFCEFFSPYDPREPDKDMVHVPPQRIRFVDDEGKFHVQPFVYNVKGDLDMRTLAEIFVPDTTRAYKVRLFVHGHPYKMWGFIPGDLHLFGTEEGGRLILFGTDNMGRDLLSLIIYGSRVSLSIGLLGVAVSFILGVLMGGISGYYGGSADIVIQRIIEFIRSVPSLPLWMGLSAALPPNWSILQTYFAIVVILSLLGWTGLARVVRGKFMAVKNEDYVMAAKLDAVGTRRIVLKYLLPSFYSYIIANLTLSIPAMILGETSLSFIGLGLQAPAISWGVLLKEAQAIRVLAQAPWLLIPGAFVVVAILAINFVGDGLRDAADPYSAV
jgi:peptide/nickel transport system permease protein